jgi:hypothetical protein
MLKRLLIYICLAAYLQTGASAKGDEAPAWLRQAASITVPPYGKSIPAVTAGSQLSLITPCAF